MNNRKCMFWTAIYGIIGWWLLTAVICHGQEFRFSRTDGTLWRVNIETIGEITFAGYGHVENDPLPAVALTYRGEPFDHLIEGYFGYDSSGWLAAPDIIDNPMSFLWRVDTRTGALEPIANLGEPGPFVDGLEVVPEPRAAVLLLFGGLSRAVNNWKRTYNYGRK